MNAQSVTYSGDGTTFTFAFPFPVFEPLEIEILVDGIVQVSAVTLLGDGANSGGAVVFATAPASGKSVILRRTGKAQVSGTDAPGFLEAKIVAGANVSVIKTTDANGEHLSIAADANPADFLAKAQNLADLTNAATARSNLGLAAVAASGSYTDLINKPNLGSAATLNVDTDPTLAADSDSLLPSQKAVKAYVTSAIIPPTAELTALQQDMMQSYLLTAIANSGVASRFINGGYDAFNIDTISVNSTGQAYESVSRFYGNSGYLTLIAPDSGTPIGNLTQNGNLAAAFNGNVTESAAQCAAGASLSQPGNPAYIGKDWGTGNSRIITGFRLWSSNDYGFTDAGVPSLTATLYGSTDNFATSNVSLGSTSLINSFGNISMSVTAGLPTTTAYRYHRIALTAAGGAGRWYVGEAQFFTASSVSSTMTLVSSALTPAPISVPSVVKLMVLHRPADTAAINTDFTAEATRDGATWSAGTLSDTGLTIAGFNVLWTEINVSAQPSGTSVKYRLKALNAKAQQVKGVAVITT